MISSITELQSFNEIFIDRILTHTDQFLPLDYVTSHAIKNDKDNNLLDFWRSSLVNIINNVNTYDYYRFIYLEDKEIDETSNLYSSPLEDQVSSFVYPYSKNNFVSHFYPDVLPSLVNTVLSYMKNSGRMIHVGQASGKALIFYPTYFTEEDFSFLLPTSYSAVISASVDINSTIMNQQADINYLLKKNQELTLTINNLKQENDKLQLSRAEDYLTTWR